MSSRARSLIAVSLTVGCLLPAGAATHADAAKPSKVSVSADGTWFTHPVGWYEVVVARAEIHSGKQTTTGDLVANVQPDDASMPAPGTCEHGMVTVVVDGDGDAPDLRITGVGDLCGHDPQEPANVDACSFSGVAYMEQVGSRRLQAREGVIDIRLAHDGRASLSATSG